MKSLKLIVISSAMLGLAQFAYADHHEHGHDTADHGQIWQTADTNNDGAVSRDEFMAMQKMHAEKKFSKLDANNDGKVDDAERNAMHQKCDLHKK
jgi:Ca2+-binding EF-hand superfamily protein